MGGSVAVTIRKPDGEIIKMARRTGSYGNIFSGKEFTQGKINEAVDNYTKIFYEMRDDYKKGEPYQFEMSDVYGHHEKLAPEGYGLVVIDFAKEKIHTMQSYDLPGFINAMEFSSVYVYDEETLKEFHHLLSNDLLLVYDKDKLLGTVQEVLGKDISRDKIAAMIKKSFKDDEPDINSAYDITTLRYLPVALKDYKIIRYEETPEGILDFAKNLKNDGFIFSEEEKSLWLNFANEILEYEVREHSNKFSTEDLVKNLEERKNNFYIEFNKEPTIKIKP